MRFRHTSSRTTVFPDIPRIIATPNLDRNAYSRGHLLPYSNLASTSRRARLSPRNPSLSFTVAMDFWSPSALRSERLRSVAKHPWLIYSGSYCGLWPSRTCRETTETARLEKAIPPPARRRGDRSINFTSLSNPIFSRYPRILHDTFY